MAMLLENMQVFTRVVELGSLSAAGRHLRLSPAVVSHRLQQLENHLGVRLLNRTTRQVQPTEQGSAYYEACLEVLAALAHAESVIADAGGTPKGNLRVTAPLGFGRRILAPLLPRFSASATRSSTSGCGCRTICSTSCARPSTWRSGWPCSPTPA